MTFLLENTSYSKCPQGFFGLAELDQCVKDCPNGQYKDISSSLCNLCPSPCKNCEGSGNKVLCITCIPDYLFDPETKTCNIGCPAPRVGNLTIMKCVENCVDGYFPSGTTRICDRCSGLCRTCDNSANSCTSCRNESYLLNNTCVKTCPVGKIQNVTSLKCEGD